MCCMIRLTRCIVLYKKREQANDAILEPDTDYRRRAPTMLTEGVPREDHADTVLKRYTNNEIQYTRATKSKITRQITYLLLSEHRVIHTQSQ